MVIAVYWTGGLFVAGWFLLALIALAVYDAIKAWYQRPR